MTIGPPWRKPNWFQLTGFVGKPLEELAHEFESRTVLRRYS